MVKNQDKINSLKDRNDLDFSEAFYLLQNGFKMHRTHWKNVLYVEMQKPDSNSKMKRPYLFCVPNDRQAVPFTLSQGDLFMSDWAIYKA